VAVVRDKGETVVLIEERAYSLAEVRRNIALLNRRLCEHDTPDAIRGKPLTKAEFADALGVGTKWVQRRVALGMIECYRVGAKPMFSPEVLEDTRERLRRGELDRLTPRKRHMGLACALLGGSALATLADLMDALSSVDLPLT